MLFEPIKPMLPEWRYEAFDDEACIFEPKWDGWRIFLHKDGDRIEAYARSGRRVTEKFPELREAAAGIRERTAILDGEGICLRDGRPVFDDFADRGRLTDAGKIAAAARAHPATFVVFDVLRTGDREHIGETLLERKARLQDLVETNGALITTLFVEGKGQELFAMTEARGLEGIVAKRKASRYQVGVRSADWQKVKHGREIDTVILGYRTEPQFGLVVGLHFLTMKNKPVAFVEAGINGAEQRAFLEIAGQIRTTADLRTQWIEPRLCCRVRYLDRTDRHELKMCEFRGFLFEKRPEDCVWVR